MSERDISTIQAELEAAMRAQRTAFNQSEAANATYITAEQALRSAADALSALRRELMDAIAAKALQAPVLDA